MENGELRIENSRIIFLIVSYAWIFRRFFIKYYFVYW